MTANAAKTKRFRNGTSVMPPLLRKRITQNEVKAVMGIRTEIRQPGPGTSLPPLLFSPAVQLRISKLGDWRGFIHSASLRNASRNCISLNVVATSLPSQPTIHQAARGDTLQHQQHLPVLAKQDDCARVLARSARARVLFLICVGLCDMSQK